MSKSGPIIVIDDDPDDQEMIHRLLLKHHLSNEIKKFSDGEEALHYFKNTRDKPFLILCDINMPLMNGLELKQNIELNAELAEMNIPFVYLTTTANPDQIVKAFNLTCQGFFIKGQSYNELKDTINLIVSYWLKAEHPK